MSVVTQAFKAVGSRLTRGSLMQQALVASVPGGFIDFLRRYGKPPDVRRDSLVRRYWGWAYSCTQVSAARFAAVPYHLYATRGRGQSKVKHFATKAVRDPRTVKWLRGQVGKGLPQVAHAEDFEELEEHPLLDLLTEVNEQENGFELRELTCTMLDLSGDAYWLLERDKLGVPTKVFVLRSQWVRIIPSRENYIDGYLYGVNHEAGRVGDQCLEFKPENVLHFKYPNPQDPWYGFGPTQAASYAIESAELREQFMLATLGNMGRPDVFIRYMEGELDGKERAAFEREWNTQFGGARKAGKVKVADYRWELEKVGWNPSELDFTRGEDWVMKKICAAYPVPVGMVDTSTISRAPRSGMEGSDLFMSMNNTLPRCSRIEGKINEQLCPLYDERLFFAFDNPVPQDRTAQLAEDTSKLNTYVTTVNEIRKRDGLDEVDWGDVPLAGPGIAPLGSQQALPPGEGAAGAPPVEGAAGQTGEEALAAAGGKDAKKPAADEPDEEDTAAASKPGAKGKPVMKVAGDGQSAGDDQVGGYALSDEVVAETDGGHVHPSLAGIPVRLHTVRNERGRFDRRGPGRLRARRATVTALKGE